MMRKGFNLIEVMIVVAIIAILASISYSMYTRKVAQARTKHASNCLGAVSAAMENYFANYGRYPDPGSETAIGFEDDGCGDSRLYRFSWELGPQNMYYKITAIDSINFVFGNGAYGHDIWVLCSTGGEPINILSPDGLNPVDPDPDCW